MNKFNLNDIVYHKGTKGFYHIKSISYNSTFQVTFKLRGVDVGQTVRFCYNESNLMHEKEFIRNQKIDALLR